MRLLKKWWFRVLAIGLAALMVAVSTLFWLSFRVSIETVDGVVSIGLLGMQAQAAEEPSIGELMEKRTRTSKSAYLGGGVYSWDGSVSPVHYESGGQWVDINNTMSIGTPPWDWQMVGDGYKTYFLNSFTSGQILKFESGGSSVTFQPMSLSWTNSLNQLQQISMPQNVPISVVNEPIESLPNVSSNISLIRWADAYGIGRHFSWINSPNRLNKLLQLDAVLPAPSQTIIDGGNPSLKLDFIFSPTSDLSIYVDGQLWDRKAKKQTVNSITFLKGSEKVWIFNSAKYWGSDPKLVNNDGVGNTILSKSGNNLFVSVLVPFAWLQGATYPVFIDPTIELFPSSYRYFHADAWDGDKKWLLDYPDGASPSSSQSSVLNAVGDYLIQGFASENVASDILSAGHWGFYLWGKHDGTTLKVSLFAEARKNSSGGSLLAATGYTSELTTSETEYYTSLDFPETVWVSGDRVWVGIYAHVTVKQNGKRAYVYYDESSRLSRVVDPTLDLQVSQDTDDVSRRLVPSYWATSYRSLMCGDYDASTYDYGGGARWNNVTVGNSDNVSNAYWSVKANEKWGASLPTFIIHGEASDNASTFSTAGDFDGRTRTTASINWLPPAWVIDTWYNSSNTSSIIQEIVNRPGWVSGNSIVKFSSHTAGWNGVWRTVYSHGYSDAAADAPKLHIEYVSGTPAITVSPTSYNFGVVQAGSSVNTTTSNFTIDNTSDIQTDQTISVTTSAWSGGNGWSHNDSGSPGDNATALLANRGGVWGTGDVIVKNAAPNFIYENAPANTDYSFGLGLWTPLTFYDGAEKTITVRVSAVAG